MIDEELLRALASTDEPRTIRPLPQIAARAAVLRRRRRGTAGAAAVGVAALAVVTGLNLTGHHDTATNLLDPAAKASVTPATTPVTTTAIAAPVTPTPQATTPVPDKQVHAKLVSLESGMITYNEVQWFEGAAARRECRKDGLQIGHLPDCNQFYYKDTNPRLRRLPIAKDMVIKVPGFRLDNTRGSGLTTVTLGQLEKFVAKGHMEILRLTISNGEIAEFDELFLS
jgi:hypothetical protein